MWCAIPSPACSRCICIRCQPAGSGAGRRRPCSTTAGHLGVDPAAVDLDALHHDHRSIDKPVPRLHDLQWLPRREVKLDPRWRPDRRTGLTRLVTTRKARTGDRAISRELRTRLSERIAADLRHFEHFLGHEIPSHWGWSTSG